MRDSKIKANGERRARNYNSRLVARDKYYKDMQHIIVRDTNLFAAGMEWFNNGFSLDDANDDMKNNNSFLDGYNRAERIDNNNRELFVLGKQWYLKGCRLEDAIEIYKNNEYFCMGFANEATLNAKKR